MDIFHNVIDILNIIITAFVSVAFGFQIIYIFICFLPKRKYKEATKKNRVGIVIAARNESEIIGRTIKILQNMNYPKDKFEIIVMADNCTDNTAEVAKLLSNEVKVRVFERFESDKKKHNVGWALNYLFEQLKPNLNDYDFFVRFDADAVVDKEYLNKMNDAYESGVKVAKGYNNAINLKQNLVAGVSGLWYIRDSRFNCHSRAALNTDVHLLGSGMMFASSIIKQDGGWICTHASEDTQFTILNIDKKRKVCYVPDAILYEDQPSTVKTILKRNVRMGKSLHNLFWTEGLKCLVKFFKTLRYAYLDMFLNLLFIPIAVLCCTWLPAYYIYYIIYYGCIGNIPEMTTYLINIGIALACAFVIPFIIQALVVCLIDRKKIKVPFKKLVGTCFAFPMFMIVYALGIVLGVFSANIKWKQVDRNVNYTDFPLDEFLNE